MKKLLITVLGCFILATAYPQDIIILKSGEEIPTIVVEVSVDVIKYKKIDNQNGPTYSIAKSDIFMITYSNGTKDVFSSEAPSEYELDIYQGNWGPKVMQNGKDLSNSQVLDLFMSNDEAHAAWSSGRSTQIAGLVIGLPCAIMWGWEIKKPAVEGNLPVLIIGTVGLVTGIIMEYSANKKMTRAVSIYNSSFSLIKTTKELNLKFGITDNGVGFLLTLK